MRVNVQLIDAETGNHLWADRFDKPLADLFDMQDEIVARLAGALNAELVAAEARRAEQVPNPDSTDLYFQGLARFYKGLTPDNMAQARSFFDRALTADPDNVDALVGFRTPALCRRAGTARGAGVRKPRKEETAGRKRRGSAWRDLWGFWGRGGIAHGAAGEGGRCYREERTRRAFSGARMRAAGAGEAAGERLRRS